MKKVLLILGFLISTYILFVTVTGYKIKWDSTEKREMIHTYLIPEGFSGCAWIWYSQSGAMPLEFNKDEVVFKIPKNGNLYTNTDYDSVVHLHSTKVFSVNEQGEQIKQLINEYHTPPLTGYSFDDKNPGDMSYIKFGPSEKKCEDL